MTLSDVQAMEKARQSCGTPLAESVLKYLKRAQCIRSTGRWPTGEQATAKEVEEAKNVQLVK